MKRIPITKIDIHILDHCNFDCDFCNHFAPYAPERCYIPSDFLSDLSKLSQYAHIRRLNIIGGEPFLHPDLRGFVKAFQELDLGNPKEIFIYTNGFWMVGGIGNYLDILKRIDKLVYSRHQPMQKHDIIMTQRLEEVKEYCRVAAYSYVSRHDQIGFTNKPNGRTRCKIADCFQLRLDGMLHRCSMTPYVIFPGVKSSPSFLSNRADSIFQIRSGDAKSLAEWMHGLPTCCQFCDYH